MRKKASKRGREELGKREWREVGSTLTSCFSTKLSLPEALITKGSRRSSKILPMTFHSTERQTMDSAPVQIGFPLQKKKIVPSNPKLSYCVDSASDRIFDPPPPPLKIPKSLRTNYDLFSFDLWFFLHLRPYFFLFLLKEKKHAE